MHLPHNLGTWGFILSVLALILMYPIGLLINLSTPAVRNWISTWSKSSLEKRIAKLEVDLAEFEKYPPITEVEHQLLWGITSIRIAITSAVTGLTIVLYSGVSVLANPGSAAFHEFTLFCLVVIVVNMVTMIIARYRRDFRSQRDPRRREPLRKAITDLKELRDHWDG